MSYFTVNLSRDSWHYKLQDLIWDSNRPTFNSLCPYFWFTIATIIISPFYLAFVAFMGVIYYGWVVPCRWVVENVFQKPLNQLLVRRTRHWLHDRDIMDVLVQISYFDKRRTRNNGQPTFLGFKLNLDEMVELLIEIYGQSKIDHYIYINSHKMWAKQALADEKFSVQSWNPLWWKSVVKYTELSFKCIAAALAIGVVLALVSFASWMLWNMPAGGYGQIGIVLCTCLVMFAGYHLLTKGVWPVLKYLGRKIGNYAGDSLIINFITSSFKNVCPTINWEREPAEDDLYHGE